MSSGSNPLLIDPPFTRCHRACTDETYGRAPLGEYDYEQASCSGAAEQQHPFLTVRVRGSDIVTARGPPSTVEASENVMPCFASFRAALSGSHSTRRLIFGNLP